MAPELPCQEIFAGTGRLTPDSFPWEVLPKPHPQPQSQCATWEQASGSYYPVNPQKPQPLSEPKEALSDLAPCLRLHHPDSSKPALSLSFVCKHPPCLQNEPRLLSKTELLAGVVSSEGWDGESAPGPSPSFWWVAS